jgi:hypothetical protein
MEGMRERCLLVVHIDCGVALIWFAVAPTMLKYTIPSIVTFLKIGGAFFAGSFFGRFPFGLKMKPALTGKHSLDDASSSQNWALLVPKLSVSQFGIAGKQNNENCLRHFQMPNWKTLRDCRSYRICGVRCLPA